MRGRDDGVGNTFNEISAGIGQPLQGNRRVKVASSFPKAVADSSMMSMGISRYVMVDVTVTQMLQPGHTVPVRYYHSAGPRACASHSAKSNVPGRVIASWYVLKLRFLADTARGEPTEPSESSPLPALGLLLPFPDFLNSRWNIFSVGAANARSMRRDLEVIPPPERGEKDSVLSLPGLVRSVSPPGESNPFASSSSMSVMAISTGSVYTHHRKSGTHTHARTRTRTQR